METKCVIGNGIVRVKSDLFKSDFVKEISDFSEIDVQYFKHGCHKIYFDTTYFGGGENLYACFIEKITVSGESKGWLRSCGVEFL